MVQKGGHDGLGFAILPNAEAANLLSFALVLLVKSINLGIFSGFFISPRIQGIECLPSFSEVSAIG